MMSSLMKGTSSLGVGVGLRPTHFPYFLSQKPQVEWVEIISENFMGLRSMGLGGRPLVVLEKIRQDLQVAMHGVSLSIGSADALDTVYLKRLKELAERIEPFIISDHLCWTGIDGRNVHDLLPLPFTPSAVNHVASKIGMVQDFLGREILMENVSSYVTFSTSEMTEWEFFSEVARQSGCGLLVDVNNIYVNAVNHGFSPLDYLHGLPTHSVRQFHLAGHMESDDILIDTHSCLVAENVWNLYREALKIFGTRSTLIEWDEEIPPIETLFQEASKAKAIMREEIEGKVYEQEA
ncbi:MAG: hypothetical protein RIR26_2739 [Pseudomonadota bacterium]